MKDNHKKIIWDVRLCNNEVCCPKLNNKTIVVSIVCFGFLFCAFRPNGVCFKCYYAFSLWCHRFQIKVHIDSTQNSLLRNYDLVQDRPKMFPNGFVCWKRAMKVKAPPTEFEHSISSGCLFENDDVTERKLVKRSNKLHWVKTFKKSTQWRLLSVNIGKINSLV